MWNTSHQAVSPGKVNVSAIKFQRNRKSVSVFMNVYCVIDLKLAKKTKELTLFVLRGTLEY
jgi:hypothetical protein